MLLVRIVRVETLRNNIRFESLAASAADCCRVRFPAKAAAALAERRVR
jgi:hypothetical protein